VVRRVERGGDAGAVLVAGGGRWWSGQRQQWGVKLPMKKKMREVEQREEDD
jgi:hypothetical protein